MDWMKPSAKMSHGDDANTDRFSAISASGVLAYKEHSV